jgi:hypothetical protein
VIGTKATDASVHGMRLDVDESLARSVIPTGETCRIRVELPGTEATFVREAEVRHIGVNGVGLAIKEPLPGALVPWSGDAPHRDTVSDSTKPVSVSTTPSGRMTALLLKLRSVVAVLFH